MLWLSLGTSIALAQPVPNLLRCYTGDAGLGWAVADIADLDGDGRRDFVAGAVNASRVVAYSSATAAPLWTAAPGLGGFGWSVSSAGDIDDDGISDVLAGAPNAGSGAVRLLSGAFGTSLLLLSYNQGFANGTTQLNIQVYRSIDAGDSWQGPAQIALNRAAFNIQPAGACSAPGAHLQTSLGVRPSTHPLGSAVWVSWNDYLPGVPANCSTSCGASNSCRSGVYLSRSDDTGVTWSAPERVPGLDAVAGDQFFSWADVDPLTGDLLVGFKDTAGDPNRLLADVVLRRSRDGSSWDPPITVSAVASTTTSTFKGDYQAIAAAGARTYLAWPDYRNRSLGDFYVATVIFDELSTTGDDSRLLVGRIDS